MSVDRRDFIVVGVDLENSPEEFYEGDFEHLCNTYCWRSNVGEITFLDDVYDGEYFIIGEVLQAVDGHYKGLDYSLLEKEELIDSAKTRVRAFIKEHFDIDTVPHVVIKTHWT